MAQEKLIVKNFGPIKDAEIELGKVTVFIGEQASGKSVLAKLVAIFKDKSLLTKLDKDIFTRFNIDSFFYDNTFIELRNRNYNLTHNNKQLTFIRIGKKLNQLLNQYKSLEKTISEQLYDMTDDFGRSVYKLLQDEQKRITNKISEVVSIPTYIPTERILTNIINSTSITLFQQQERITLPECLLDFLNDFNFAKQGLTTKQIPFLGINFFSENNEDFVILESEHKLPLSKVSSGFQSAIPLFVVIEEQAKIGNQLFIVEEPELNLYPSTQKKLVEYLAGKTDKNSLILTTHSPYILSSLDNLIQAGNVVKKHPELAAEVEKIIPSQYHLNYEDVKVYFVADGKARLIMNEELQSIDVSELDQVSENLDSEFEKLLDLKYQD